MTECILAWVCIIIAFFSAEPMWAVASAIFALVVRLEIIAQGRNRKDGEG